MDMDALARAAEAAGYAMASIEEFDDVAPPKPTGDAVARGARDPKPVLAKAGELVPVGAAPATKSVATGLAEQSVAAAQAIRQAVYGYIGGRGAPA
ncbi:MAG TPA: hypothetical protein PK970_13760 [Hyphomicrobiaceae bacterium]|nr:hypothetical protein [Hyphomicrobiaceae bacterium]